LRRDNFVHRPLVDAETFDPDEERTFAMAVINGTSNSETLDGADGVTNGIDTIDGKGGNDAIYGLGGNDLITGGEGADHLDGGAGDDWAYYYFSSVGVMVSLASGTGLMGEAEGDTLVNIERLWGSQHGDTLVGDGGVNWLWGDRGNDILKGGGGVDELHGDYGNDTLKGGGGADLISGGDGNDTAAYNESAEGVFVSLGGSSGYTASAYGGDATGDRLGGIENLTGSEHEDDLWGNNIPNTLHGLGGDDTLKGYGSADRLWGGEGHDSLAGGEGDDILRGENGNDTINGGLGRDTMIGGHGNDIYYADNGNDTVTEAGGQGTDEVRASVSWILNEGADVEILRTTNDNGTANLFLIGNDASNEIIGNNGDNYLEGRGGNDTLVGRLGNDQYVVDGANDIITEAAGQGIDTVYADANYRLNEGADVEYLTIQSDLFTFHQINLTGNSAGNIVIGNHANNIINGGAGNDELTGNLGHDLFLFDTALDAAFNVDVITDFDVGDDTILLDQDIFSSSLGLGNISDGEFVIGSAAQDANDRIVYDAGTGALLYDSDGAGGTAAIRFAQLDPGLALTSLDFYVV
jgi:Ca2+-binding RTX toxin-like protein